MRKLATAAAISLVLASQSARALILGEIEMHSALNQPMNAEIALTSVADGELDDMIVKLASAEAFARAGIDRSRLLLQLSFNLEKDRQGRPIIRISSKDPIQEPFLNFLLEVHWPRGRMVREYTVLLDPPVFMTPSATTRNSAADNPTVRNTQLEDSLLTPMPIERDGSDEFAFDESQIVVSGADVEVGDDVVATAGQSAQGVPVELDLTETLEPVADDSALLEQLLVVDDAVVGVEADDAFTLSDVEVAVPLDSSELVIDNGTEWDVAVMGGTQEVSNDAGASDLTFDSVVDMSGSSARTAPASGGTAGNSVTVNKNDTLWEIANRHRVGGLTTQQMMIALLEANRHAFINGNINLVKAGAILRIPDATTAVSQTQALAEVRQQEQLWQEYRDSARGIRTGTSTSVASASQSRAEAQTSADSGTSAGQGPRTSMSPEAQDILKQAERELKLVAEDTTVSSVASATADETQAPEQARQGEINRKLQELQLSREELTAARVEADDLREQDTELQELTENMDQLVALQQSQLARLQQQLDQAKQESATAADVPITETDFASVDGSMDGADAQDSLMDALDAAAEQAPDAGLPQVELIGETDPAAMDTPDTTGQMSGQADPLTASTDTTAANTQDSTVYQPIPVRKVEPWWKQILNNFMSPMYLGIAGLGTILAGALAYLLMRRRRKIDDDELDLDAVTMIDEDGFDEQEFGEVEVGGSDVQPMDDEPSHDDTSRPAAGVAAALAGVAAAAGAKMASGNNQESEPEAGEPAADEGDDTLSEADVFLAYGLHDQAEELLTGAVNGNPDVPEYRFKLLQCYHAQNKTEPFDREAQVYHDHFGGTSSPQWPEIVRMGQDMGMNTPLYSDDADGVANVGVGSWEDGARIDEQDISDMSAGSDVATSAGAFAEFSDSTSAVGGTGDDLSASFDALTASEASAEPVAEPDANPDANLDPGLAFDETDFEATGDFSQMTDELKEEFSEEADDAIANAEESLSDAATQLDTGSIDLQADSDDMTSAMTTDLSGLTDSALDTGLDAVEDDVENLLDQTQSLSDTAAAELDAANEGIVEFDAGGLGDSLNDNLDSIADSATDAVDNATDSLSAAADSLSDGGLDFVDDVSLDTGLMDTPAIDDENTELMDTGLDLTQELEIPDLTSNTDLTADASDAFGNEDEMDTMMDLAKAYIDMGDKDSASSALGEIVKSGNAEQRSEAETLLRKIS